MNIPSDRIDALFSAWDKLDSPGCVLAIIKGGEFVYKRGYGMADLERGVPIRADSIFDLGSTGKQFTAAVIAILTLQGFLGLDDPIRKYLPEMPPYAEAIAIRHLIHHTSGLRDYLTLMELSDRPAENIYPEDKLLDLITRQRELNFPPGEEYLYSNSGYFLLGMVAQRVTGKHLTELIREHVYEPLSMKHSTFNKDHRPIVPNRALSYSRREDGTIVNEISLCGGFGDGAVCSSVEDLFLWDQNFYHNRLNHAQPDLLELMRTTGMLRNGETIPYAAGLFIEDYRGLQSVSHGGSWAGYRSELLRFPRQHFSVICLCNLSDMEPEELARRVADICLEDELQGRPGPRQDEKPEPASESISLPPGQLTRFTGTYVSQELDTEYILSLQADRLFLQRSQFAAPELLHPIASHIFKGREIELCFDENNLSVASGRLKNIRFKRA